MKYEKVAVGDEFILTHRWKSEISKVTSVTPKRFAGGGYTFAKKDGYQVGGDTYSRTSIILCTDEARQKFYEKYHRANLIRELESTKFKELSLDKLEKIKAVLDQVA